MALHDKALRSKDFTGNGLVLLGDYLARRLKALRLQNDKHLDPYATAGIRGRIAEIAYLANLVEPVELPQGVTATLDVEEIDEAAERWLQRATTKDYADATEE